MRRSKITDWLSREEIARLTRPSDLQGARAIVTSWGVIAVTFAVLARFPHPLTFAVAVFVLGGRQLALVVAMHEAAHRTLFRTRWLNDGLADWVCARPVWTDVARYRRHHVAHHAHTGTERDPDRSLVAPFPTTRGSLARKCARDLLFVSGARRAFGLALMDLEVLQYNVSGDAIRVVGGARSVAGRMAALARNAGGMVLTNGALVLILRAAGAGWLYWAWAIAWLTTYGFFLRIRALAEHACTEATDDALRNTRTTHAGLLARATVAPLNVNYHLEHHLLVGVPWYRLPELHRLLRSRGALDGAFVAPGYTSVLRAVTTPLVGD